MTTFTRIFHNQNNYHLQLASSFSRRVAEVFIPSKICTQTFSDKQFKKNFSHASTSLLNRSNNQKIQEAKLKYQLASEDIGTFLVAPTDKMNLVVTVLSNLAEYCLQLKVNIVYD